MKNRSPRVRICRARILEKNEKEGKQPLSIVRNTLAVAMSGGTLIDSA